MNFSVKIAPEKRKNKAGEINKVNVPVFADIRYQGKRLFYYTGVRVNVNFDHPSNGAWDVDSCRVRKNNVGLLGRTLASYADINRRFKAIEAALELYFQGTKEADKKAIISLLDDVCLKAATEVKETVVKQSEFLAAFDDYTKAIKMSENRRRHYQSVKNHWKRFAEKRRLTLTFETVTVEVLRDFERYLENESTRPKARNKPDDQVLSPKGKNTLHSILSKTRTVWRHTMYALKRQGRDIGYPFSPGSFNIQGEVYGEPIYPSKAELDKLRTVQLSSEKLIKVRDIFLFQCAIGARVGDLCKLTRSNLQNDEITYIASKTIDGKPVPVTIPLSKNALEILNRYNLPSGRLLPFISDQRYNEYLKELFTEAELTRVVTRLNPTSGVPEQVRLCDIASSHMARRAFVGMLYEAGTDREIIAAMSGHRPWSKAFSRYHGVSSELKRKAISMIA